MFDATKHKADLNLGERVQAARLAHNMTLADLATASKLTKGFLSQVENGHSNPSLDSLGRIAAALGVSVLALLGAQPGSSSGASTLSAPRAYRRRPAGVPGSEISVLFSGAQSTVVMVQLALGAAIRSPETIGEGKSVEASCAVLQGYVTFEQDTITQEIGVGDALVWNTARHYKIENDGHLAASLVLWLGGGADLPLLDKPVSARVAHYSPGRTAQTQVEGPLRLVAMRAARHGQQGR